MDPLTYIAEKYLKIVRINLSDGSFDVCLKWKDLPVPNVTSFMDWLDDFIKHDMVHPDDLTKFKEFVNLEKWREWIAGNEAGVYCSYRRKDLNGNYIHVAACIIRDKERYDEQHEYGILFVKDIDSMYRTEYECILEDIGTKDGFTNLLNRFAYQRDISRYKGGNVGVLFADLNGLKHVNDKQGHAAGDKLILDFANLLKRAFSDYKIYHISGDEFVVIGYDVSLRSFLQRVLGWHRWIWEQGKYPMAAVGYSLDAGVTDIADLVTEAENAMYVDKDIFRSRYPEYKR